MRHSADAPRDFPSNPVPVTIRPIRFDDLADPLLSRPRPGFLISAAAERCDKRFGISYLELARCASERAEQSHRYSQWRSPNRTGCYIFGRPGDRIVPIGLSRETPWDRVVPPKARSKRRSGPQQPRSGRQRPDPVQQHARRATIVLVVVKNALFDGRVAFAAPAVEPFD